MSAILNLIMFLQLSCGLRYCTEFGTWMANYAPNDGIFKLAIRNKFNTAAATILHFHAIIQSPMKTFYPNFI